jgi:hypothetical protein
MELWEKQHAYIPREFVWSKWSSADRFVHGRGWSSSSSFDHPVLAGSSWPEVLPRLRGCGDGRHWEPRQVSAVTIEENPINCDQDCEQAKTLYYRDVTLQCFYSLT